MGLLFSYAHVTCQFVSIGCLAIDFKIEDANCQNISSRGKLQPCDKCRGNGLEKPLFP